MLEKVIFKRHPYPSKTVLLNLSWFVAPFSHKHPWPHPPLIKKTRLFQSKHPKETRLWAEACSWIPPKTPYDPLEGPQGSVDKSWSKKLFYISNSQTFLVMYPYRKIPSTKHPFTAAMSTTTQMYRIYSHINRLYNSKTVYQIRGVGLYAHKSDLIQTNWHDATSQARQYHQYYHPVVHTAIKIETALK